MTESTFPQTLVGRPLVNGALRFEWRDTLAILDEVRATHQVCADDKLRSFEVRETSGELVARLIPPLVLPIAPSAGDVDRYSDELPDELGVHLVVLLQAGAAALGMWRGGELIRHKVLKRYVVRGNGKAQPTYLAKKGKSRYGSRLRLYNARRLEEEVNEKLGGWCAEIPIIEQAFYSCPIRAWAGLFRAEPPPPLPRERFRKIPLDLGVPNLAQLLHAYRQITAGRVERIG